jgi:predicted dehydrogenase
MRDSTLYVIIVGCGSIGTRHLENIQTLGGMLVSVVETDAERARVIREKYAVPVFSSLEEWESSGDECDAAVICSPSSEHAEHALRFAGRGSHLFIEKPAGTDLSSIAELERVVREKNLITFVGYNMRFYPLFVKLKKLLDQRIIGKIYAIRGSFGYHLPLWRPNIDYRKTYSARRVQGGGILFDSHEFDYLSWFGGDIRRIFCQAKRIGDLDIDVEDIADVVVEFASGAVGSLELDYLRRSYDRSFECIGSAGSLRWEDSESYKGTLVMRVDGQDEVIYMEPEGYDRAQTYLDETRHFLECVAVRRQTACPLESGTSTLSYILAAKRSSETGRVITLARSDEGVIFS